VTEAAPGRLAAEPPRSVERPTTLQLVVGFGLVYVIWGSTYLAIRIAIATIPPLLMAGFRFLLAGGGLYAWVRLRGRGPGPTPAHWRSTALLGALLFLIGNGAVVWAEQTVPSGLVALLVGMLPLWMVLVDWLWGSRRRPTATMVVGMLWGLAGVGLLAGSDSLGGGLRATLVPIVVVLTGGVAWAFGSIRMKSMPLPSQPGLATAMDMLWGGVWLVLAAGLVGELGRFHVAAVSTRSVIALLYLVVFGSLVAFSAFLWLMSVATPAQVATYAYVNPVVALFLGWALADEPVGARTLIAAAMILSAVVLITRRGER
jgi:drug/metabolite transporter (DMT)-like permease